MKWFKELAARLTEASTLAGVALVFQGLATRDTAAVVGGIIAIVAPDRGMIQRTEGWQ